MVHFRDFSLPSKRTKLVAESSYVHDPLTYITVLEFGEFVVCGLRVLRPLQKCTCDLVLAVASCCMHASLVAMDIRIS